MIRVLIGKNGYALKKDLRKTIADFVTKYGDSVERFDGSELASIDSVLDAVRSISFLEPRKLVVVRDFGQSKELMDRIEDIVGQVADSTDFVLVDEKLDKRTAGYKYLKKNVEVIDYIPLQEYESEKWLTKLAAELTTKLSPSAAKYLIARVGNDQLRLEQELIKLASNGREVTQNLIDDLTEQQPQSKVFDMLDALFQGRLDSAWMLYKDQRA